MVGTTVKWFFIIGFSLLAFSIGLNFFGILGKVASTPGRVIDKTLDTNNVIQSYEWFYDTKAAYDARHAQVQQFTHLLQSEEDKAEKRKLRIEASAIQQSCRELVTKYNANSEKMNKKIFKGWTLPHQLVLSTCN